MRHGSAAWGRSLAAGFVGLSGLATGSLELGELTGDGFLVGLGVLSAGAVLAIAAALSGRQSGTAARVVGYLLALPLAIGFWYLGGLVAQLAEALAMLALLNYLRSCVNDIWGPVQRWITVAQVGALLLLAMAGLALTALRAPHKQLGCSSPGWCWRWGWAVWVIPPWTTVPATGGCCSGQPQLR